MRKNLEDLVTWKKASVAVLYLGRQVEVVIMYDLLGQSKDGGCQKCSRK